MDKQTRLWLYIYIYTVHNSKRSEKQLRAFPMKSNLQEQVGRADIFKTAKTYPKLQPSKHSISSDLNLKPVLSTRHQLSLQKSTFETGHISSKKDYKCLHKIHNHISIHSCRVANIYISYYIFCYGTSGWIIIIFYVV